MSIRSLVSLIAILFVILSEAHSDPLRDLDRAQIVSEVEERLSADELAKGSGLTDLEVNSAIEDQLQQLSDIGYTCDDLVWARDNHMSRLLDDFGDGSRATIRQQDIDDTDSCKDPGSGHTPTDVINDDPAHSTPDIFGCEEPYCIERNEDGDCVKWAVCWDPGNGAEVFAVDADGEPLAWVYECSSGCSPPVNPDHPYNDPAPVVEQPSTNNTGNSAIGNSASQRNRRSGQQERDLGKNGANQTDCHPVLVSEGFKVEEDVDFRVALPGRDFVFYRAYNAGNLVAAPEFPWLIGKGWGTSADGWATLEHPYADYEDALPAYVSVLTFPLDFSSKYYDRGPLNNQVLYEPLGPSDSMVRAANHQAYGPVWVLDSHDQGQTIFYRSEGANNDFIRALDGHIAERVDPFGNKQLFKYEQFLTASGSLSNPRIKKIILKVAGLSPVDQDVAANVQFEWDTGVVGSPGTGLIRRVYVERPVANQWVVTDYAEYTYRSDNPTSYSHLAPGANNLVMAETATLVNAPPEGASSAPGAGGLEYQTRYTQYRYNAGNRLSHLFGSEQVEFFAEKWAMQNGSAQAVVGSFGQASLVRAAAQHLLTLDSSDSIADELGAGSIVADLASKILSYYGNETFPERGYGQAGSMEGMVKQQILQNACGCGSGASKSRIDYEYSREFVTDDTIVSDTGVTVFTIYIGHDTSLTKQTEYLWESGAWRAHRVTNNYSIENVFRSAIATLELWRPPIPSTSVSRPHMSLSM